MSKYFPLTNIARIEVGRKDWRRETQKFLITGRCEGQHGSTDVSFFLTETQAKEIALFDILLVVYRPNRNNLALLAIVEAAKIKFIAKFNSKGKRPKVIFGKQSLLPLYQKINRLM
ncbi:MAG: hypothetical protein WCW02_01545 [Candidatus Buchananbacteria bacterium]